MTQSHPPESSSLPVSCIVGIGVSSGGVIALSEFFSRLQGHRLAFVVVHHLDAADSVPPLRDSLLPIVEISNGIAIQAGAIYFAPLHALVTLEAGIFSVQPAEGLDQRRSAIDYFFGSLAEDFKQKSIGIVFSGEGSDGTEGLKAIGDAGGMTIAQSPDTAEYPSMPETAIRSGAVDHILTINGMADEIASYEKYILRLLDQTHISHLRDQIASALVSICDILNKATGHDFKHYKTNTLVRRIQRRMQILQLRSVEAYVERLQDKSEEIDALFKELLINVTSFFRDPAAFDELRASVLQNALAKHSHPQKYRVWIAGCSTGEEAYTVAIIIREIIETLKVKPVVQIIATDIDEVALNTARRGSYSASIVEEVSEERLRKFFTRKGGRYIVTPELRDMCLFTSHNLINDPPFSQLDLLTCRNVLIYLGPHLQQKLIPVFHYALRANGHLFLGTSESLTGHQELFRTVSAKFRIAQSRTTAIKSQVNLNSVGSYQTSKAHEPMHGQEVDLTLVGQRIVLDEFSPKYAIVNDEGMIHTVSSGVHHYFAPSEGNFQNNILKQVKPSIRTALRSAFTTAKKHKRKVTNENCNVEIEGEFQRLGLTVQPMPQLGEGISLYLVVFQYFGRILNTDVIAKGADSTGASFAAVEQLERELTMMRDDLDKTVQDLEASNEELKSSNEELLSMNEELQAANEELETSKEDVQAANDALIRSNSDLENLLTGTEIATLFLDDQLHIKNFTKDLSQFYPILISDIGRSIGDFMTKAQAMPPFPARDELAQSGLSEVEISMPDGRTFLRRVLPYKTHEGHHDGLVVTFIDISELRQSEGRFQTLANIVPCITWIGTPEGKLIFFNSRWFEYTGQSQSSAAQDGPGEFIHPDDKDFLKSEWQYSLDSGEEFQGEFRLRRQDGEYLWYLGRGVALRDRSGKILQWFGTCTDIEMQKAEVDLLKESGEGLRTIVEAIPQFIWRANADGEVDYCSESFDAFVGKPSTEVLGWQWLDLVHEDDRKMVEQEWAKARAAQTKVDIDFRIMREGKEHWVKAEGNPYFSANGILVKYYGTWSDIQRQVNTEQERLAARHQVEIEGQKFEALFAEAPSAMALLRGPRFALEKANSMYRQLVGEHVAFGTEIAKTLPEGQNDLFVDLMSKVYSTGVPYFDREARVVFPDWEGKLTREYFLDFAFQRIVDAEGQPYGIYVHATDVTDRVLARQRLIESKSDLEDSESRFRLLADAMPQIVFTADDSGNFDYFNQRWFEYTGLTFEESKGWNWGPVLHEADLQMSVNRWTESITTGLPYEIEYRIKCGSDLTYRWHLGRAVPITDVNNRIVKWFGTNTDIHDVKLLAEELRAAKQNAESANQIKSRFLANMSHEIRTPLGVIIGFTDLLREHLDDKDDTKGYIERISTNALQLGSLIDEILDLSKIEADRLEAERVTIDLEGLLEDVFKSMSMIAKDKDLAFEKEWQTPVPSHVVTDPNRFRQILINIIGNAIKFTDQGAVTISLTVNAKGMGRTIEVRVTDTGIGLNKDQQARIFEPFMQADNSVTRRFGGTGLGLALSKRLAKVLGGDLILEKSEPGKGSTFIVIIDIGESSVGVESRASLAVSAEPSKYLKLPAHLKVLIVDDSPDNRAIVSRFLKLSGASSDTAENGQIAVEKALTETFDLILMDIQMPIMDGYQALGVLRENNFPNPIVALTAHAMKEEKDKCMKAGFNGYLSKPVDRHNLLQLIHDFTKK